MATPVTLASVPDHVAGDEYTEAMWKSVEAGINQGVVEQIGVQASRNAPLNVADTNPTNVGMDTAVKDVYGMWDGAQGFFAPVQGWYHWAAFGDWSVTSVTKGWEIQVKVGGAIQQIVGGDTQNDNTHTTHLHGAGLVYLQAGDKVSFQVVQRTGSTINLNDFTASLVRA